MRLTIIVRKQALGFLALALIIYITTVILALFFKPVPLANFIGCLSLVTYTATLMPSMVKKLFPIYRVNKLIVLLLRYRRYIGVIAFFLALNHGFLMVIQKQINLLNPYIYLEYFQGMSMLFIFTLLAITSNDWSVKKLKRNWKRLHSLTYVAIFLMPWHILDKMSGHWSYVTPFALLLSLVILVLFLKRQMLNMNK
jgi:sulfoxide reductase heme-binding subunit YedZ